MPNPFDQLEAQQASQDSKTPITPPPRKGGNAFDQLELRDKDKGMSPPTSEETAAMGGKEIGRSLANNADTIGGIAGFGLGSLAGIPIGGAMVGAGIGNAIGHEVKERIYGEPKQTGTFHLPITNTDTHVPNAAATMAGAGALEGAGQKYGPAVLKGLMKIPGLMTDALEGAAPKPGLFPALPEVPTSLAGSTTSGKQGIQAALGALDESLAGFKSHPGTFETGVAVQDALHKSSDIWHREGGKLYDKARSMIGDLSVDSKPLKNVGAQIEAGNNPTAVALPRSGQFEPKVQAILDDINDLGDKVPFQALDGLRKKLIAIATDQNDTLAQTQAKGMLSKLTGGITETMEKGLGVGTAEHSAWKEARTFYKEGGDIFDHKIMEKALNSNPEDVVAMFRPDAGATPASISEARQIRSGMLDFVEKNGTPEEIGKAKETYSKFLDLFTRRNVLSNGGDITELPKKIAGYKEILPTLYGATSEGKVVLENLNTLSGAVDKAMAGIPIQKGAETAVATKVLRARQTVKSTITAISGYAGYQVGGVQGAGLGGFAGKYGSDLLMDRVLQSPTATKMLSKEIERTVARSYAGTAESISLEPIATMGEGGNPWMTRFIAALNQGQKYSPEIYNAARTVKLGSDVKKGLGEIPTRK